jgi:hypothetical protein
MLGGSVNFAYWLLAFRMDCLVRYRFPRRRRAWANSYPSLRNPIDWQQGFREICAGGVFNLWKCIGYCNLGGLSKSLMEVKRLQKKSIKRTIRLCQTCFSSQLLTI